MRLLKPLLFTLATSLTGLLSAEEVMPDGFQTRIYQQGGFQVEVVEEIQRDDQEVVVLMHGWPQDWTEWRRVMPMLSEDYHVVALNLRGIGETSDAQTPYVKTDMAKDALLVLKQMGAQNAHFVGHDIGGMVAFAVAAQHPEKARSVAIIDVPLPGFPHFDVIAQDPRAWHFGFHATVGLPEAIIAGNQQTYFSHFFAALAANPKAISTADIARFSDVYSTPKSLRSGFEFYRAFAGDAQYNQAVSLEKSPAILVMGGEFSMGGLGQMIKSELEGKGAKNVSAVTIPGSGHWVAEENPLAVASSLKAFFAQH